MQRIVFWLTYPLLKLISLLPFRLLYIVSDVIFFIVYYLVRYRKKTVNYNLHLVFPSKTEQELRRIRIAFYRHMVDMFLEMIKSISLEKEELKKRFVFTNIEELEELLKQNKSVLLACGHYASYEWIFALQLYDIQYKAYGIYKKVKNKYFDNLVKEIRERFDAELIPTSEARKKMKSKVESGDLGIYAMVADQSPRLAKSWLWTSFMGHLVPVFPGLENLSRTLDMNVVYLEVEKTSRGHYRASFKTLCSDCGEVAPYTVVKKYFELLEKQILKAPQYYLWTHKRWKHKQNAVPHNGTLVKRDLPSS